MDRIYSPAIQVIVVLICSLDYSLITVVMLINAVMQSEKADVVFQLCFDNW